MENPWLTVTLASPLNPSTSVGNLSHAPLLPDPPDPPDLLQFPPLPSPLSGGQKPPKRRSFSRPSPKTTVPAPLLSTASVAAVNGSFAGAATPPSLPTLSTAELLATFTSLPPCHVSNPRSGLSTVNHESQISLSVPSPPPHHSSVAPPPTITISPDPPPPSTALPLTITPPASSSPPKEKALNQSSMEIDSSPLQKDTTIDFLETDSEKPENCILALPVVFKDRPIIISTNPPRAKIPSILSANPFQLISPPPRHPPRHPPYLFFVPPTTSFAPNPESLPAGEAQSQS
ncbi:unnamed protein product [Brassica oleracea var. botrytis]